ncbi:MAG: hypothetical protein HYU37_19485 [Acidobacteria bacterium]|nr:hypothetical protein [Acidobacteriota bacterium]
MDFIERLFGVSPDGGNGTFELLLLTLPLCLIVLVQMIRRARDRKVM